MNSRPPKDCCRIGPARRDRGGRRLRFGPHVCRRAERNVVRLIESGEAVEPNILAYLNRLSDLLWLFARKVEAGRRRQHFTA